MDIVEKLRSPEVLITHGQMISPVAFEAADEIERLREIIDRVSDWCEVNNPRILMEDYYETKIERLREALKIFGAYADYLDEDYGDYPDHHVSKAFGGNILVFGDFRKARAALREGE